VTAGYLVKTDNLVGTEPTPTATLKDPSNAAAYYDVLCGTSWKEAAVALEEKGRALMNIGGYSGPYILETKSPVILVKMFFPILDQVCALSVPRPLGLMEVGLQSPLSLV